MGGFDPKTDLQGIVASLHTPFTDQGEIDTASLARLVDHAAGAGCRGVLVAAVAGEVSALTPVERARLLSVVAEAAAGRLAIVAGVSAPDLATSCRLAAEAAAADMVLWQPPPDLGDDQLEPALGALAAAGPGAIMLQDLDWQGAGLAPELIARLAERIPALSAVKIETVPAGPKYGAVQAASGGRLHLSGGWAAMQMMEGLARGLDAFVPSGILPLYARVFALWQAGRHAAAQALFERALPVLAFSNQHIDVSIRFWKRVRVMQGIFASDQCRIPAPFDAVQAAEAERLATRALDLEAEAGAGDSPTPA